MFLSCTYIVVLTNLIDLSHFFNKYVLYIPSNHFILTFRVILWGWMACLAFRELYVFIKEEEIKRLGAHIWLFHLILMVEYMILFKFMESNFLNLDNFI